MKETYFSSTIIDDVSLEMLARLDKYKRNTLLPYDPARSALLVLDMQAFFLDPGSHAFIPSSQAIVPRVKSLVDAYSIKGYPVFFTRHANTPHDAGNMAEWWQDLVTLENPSSQLIPDLATTGAPVLIKSQYDAFFGTSLNLMLRQKGVKQVVICGVMTHLCCDTTARSAFTRGYRVFFTVDGTATYNKEFHLATLINLSHGFATPLLVSEILGALHEAR